LVTDQCDKEAIFLAWETARKQKVLKGGVTAEMHRSFASLRMTNARIQRDRRDAGATVGINRTGRVAELCRFLFLFDGKTGLTPGVEAA
jgi:hypothetical protein